MLCPTKAPAIKSRCHKIKDQRYPRIHDISTGVVNPPKFVAIVPMPPGPVLYPGSKVAAFQLKAYPELKTLVLPVPKDQAFSLALDTAREMGWQIVAAVPVEGRIEGTDTTRWFGFKVNRMLFEEVISCTKSFLLLGSAWVLSALMARGSAPFWPTRLISTSAGKNS